MYPDWFCLFGGKGIRDEFKIRKQNAIAEAKSLNRESIENRTQQEIVDAIVDPYLFGELSVGGPVVMHPEPVSIAGVGSRVTFDLSVSGDLKLLDFKPFVSPPADAIEGRAITDESCIRRAATGDGDSIKSEIMQWERYVRSVIDRLNADAKACNQELLHYITDVVRIRVEELNRHQEMVAQLPFPMKRLSTAPLTVAPLKRKKTLQQLIAQNSRQSGGDTQYFVRDEEYDYILRVLHDMSSVLSSNPSTFRKLLEEDLRNVLLTALNGHYERVATGETFSQFGKADIHVAHSGAVIFVGECKCWEGPKALCDAIDQLSDYLGTADGKAAIIIFNKDAKFSHVLSEARKAVESHPQYEATLKEEQTVSRYRFKHKRDPDGRFTLALLCFDIAKK